MGRYAEQADASVLAVPSSMWRQLNVRAMPTLFAYNGGVKCGDSAGRSGAAWKTALDGCGSGSGGGGSGPAPPPPPPPPPPPSSSRRRRSPPSPPAGEDPRCRPCTQGSGCLVGSTCYGPHNGFPGDHSQRCSMNRGLWCGPKSPAIPLVPPPRRRPGG